MKTLTTTNGVVFEYDDTNVKVNVDGVVSTLSFADISELLQDKAKSDILTLVETMLNKLTTAANAAKESAKV